MSIYFRIGALGCLLLAAPWPAVADSAGQPDPVQLRSDFMTEARLLDAGIDEYFDTRAVERQAMAELARLNALIDQTLGDPHSSPAELVRLEAQAAVARDRAFAAAADSAETRHGLYDGMQRLTALGRRLERAGVAPTEETRGVSGSWQVEAGQLDVVGFLDLRQEGAVLSGSYRLSNGFHGSVTGIFAGRRLELQLIDSQRGTVGDIQGELDPESGEIHGTWHARELAASRPVAGDWKAWRVALE
ncbi:MAG: hypothetical protein V3T72_13090 [Thermoanaerobaculia bacterium]